MEASALHAPAGVSRLRNPAGASFLRLRSDDQLVDLFRAGHEEAFRVIHDRYRARLFAYMRQMLSGSRQDAEDALQDVFIRAYSGLRANDRHLALRAWLYRVAHNRCVDQLRKNMPILTEEIEATSQDVSTDPMAAMQQREELRKLITDVQRLPEQQRSALLLREMSGMSYQELADSLELSIPAIKSLLVRARVGLAAAAEARDTDCSQIRCEIVDSHERGARPNALTRRHLSDCTACREYRESVRGVSKSLAALVPAAPLILAAKFLGVGTAYSAAAYSSGGAAAGGAAAGGAAAAGAAAGGAAAAGAAAVSGAAAGGAAAGGAAAAAGGAAATGAVAGGVAASGAAVAGGVSAAHIAAIIAAAAAAGGAVAVSDQSSAHHASAPLHPASNVIHQAVKSGITHGYAPAAVAPVAPVTAVTPATAPASTAGSTIANAVITKLKHQATTPSTAPTSAATTSTTAAASSAGVTGTSASGGSSLAATGTAATGQTTATGGASAVTTASSPTSIAPVSSSTAATTSSAPASTAGTSSAASTTPVHTDSTSAAGATTAGSSTTSSSTASPTSSTASTPPPTS